MSEGRTDGSRAGQADDRGRHERDKEEFEADTGYRPSTNQAQDEPLPASHHDDDPQAEGRRPGEPGRDDPSAPDQTGPGQVGEGETRQEK